MGDVMMLDFQNPSVMEGIIVFPDWAVSSEPKPPEQIIETIYLEGTTAGSSQSIRGSADQQ
jgi:hypothetical protein